MLTFVFKISQVLESVKVAWIRIIPPISEKILNIKKRALMVNALECQQSKLDVVKSILSGNVE